MTPFLSRKITYKHVGASLRKMKTSGFVQDTQEMSVDDLLKYLVVTHLIDNIFYEDKIDLFLSLFNKNLS